MKSNLSCKNHAEDRHLLTGRGQLLDDMKMIGTFFLGMGTENSKFPGTTTGQPAVESPKRVPDRQMGQPSFVLGGQLFRHYPELDG